jgi:methyltransferase
MSALYPTLAVLALLRLGELELSRRNAARLLARGGREVGARHYPLFFLLHGGWFAALALLAPPEPRLPALLAAFWLLQAARVWTIWSLGPYWTTRIVTLDEAPLVRRGPYRWCRHPNYLIVAIEIALLPLAFGAWETALVFSLLNGLLLSHRIRVETAALAARRYRATAVTDDASGVRHAGDGEASIGE